jgi:hypothetical protein
MYTLRRDEYDFDPMFIVKVEEFLKHAFGESARGHSLVVCPCSGCDNMRRKDRFTMGIHIVKFGFTLGYHRWIHHGEADRIREGGNYSSFDKYRQFLALDHPFREDIKSFTKGVKVTDPRLHLRTAAEVHAQIDALVPNEDGGFVGYGDQHMWTHKSGLTRLPYFDDLLLPHNIDVMHTKKNIAEALWATLMDTNKSKDNPKARVDLATLCDRPNLEMRHPG